MIFSEYKELCDTIHHISQIEVFDYKKKEADLAINIVNDATKFLSEL